MIDRQALDITSIEPTPDEPDASAGPTRGKVAPPIQPPRPKPTPRSRSRKIGTGAAVAAVTVWLIAAYAIQDVVRRAIGEYWIAYPSDTSIEYSLQAVPYNHLGWMSWGLLQARRTVDRAAPKYA